MPTLTAAQRRAAARAEYDAFLAACPSRQILARISDKWVTLILVAFAGGPLRYSDLGRIIAGVSQKMLTQTLRTLERDGLVSRTRADPRRGSRAAAAARPQLPAHPPADPGLPAVCGP